MRRSSRLLPSLLLLLLLPGCKPQRYETAKAYVSKLAPRPVRGGYTLVASYVFTYDGDTLRGLFKYGKRHPAELIKAGDTLILQFPAGKPARHKIKSVLRPLHNIAP